MNAKNRKLLRLFLLIAIPLTALVTYRALALSIQLDNATPVPIHSATLDLATNTLHIDCYNCILKDNFE